jgi:hypothetical protein|tara:strand:+ start:1656 stop:2582 length:927 start_codon:yes stop_codon:yes gene_type:complete
MAKKELVSWVKDGLAKGHDIEKLLGHLKTQGYADVDIVEVRSHVSGEKKPTTGHRPPTTDHQPLATGNTFMQVMHWVNGIFHEPQETIKEIVNKSRLIHVSIMGAIAIAVLFSTFILNGLLMTGLQTLPSQIMDKFTTILSPQGSFAKVIAFGELSLTGVLSNLVAVVVHYFVPLLGISLVATLLLRGFYHKGKFWDAYKIIGIPYGAIAVVMSFLNLGIVPFMFIAEKVGSASFMAKMITSVIIGIQIIIIFLGVAVSIYSYVAYAMTIKEKYNTTDFVSTVISIASTATVVVAILPLIALFVISVF